jgi:hypothetical protein
MTTFSFLLQLKEFPLQLLLHRKLQSTACDSFSLDFTLLHSVRRSKFVEERGMLRFNVNHILWLLSGCREDTYETNVILFSIYSQQGHLVEALRTRRKVAGSTPDEVIGIFH